MNINTSCRKCELKAYFIDGTSHELKKFQAMNWITVESPIKAELKENVFEDPTITASLIMPKRTDHCFSILIVNGSKNV
jgi:hypothetical protein